MRYQDDLDKEIAAMLQSGMTQISKDSLVSELDRLGYSISTRLSFNYFNGSNKNQYPARSCYIIETDTGKSFANIEARSDGSFKSLQDLRRSVFCVHLRRLWEL
jgi:hypothetical protein